MKEKLLLFVFKISLVFGLVLIYDKYFPDNNIHPRDTFSFLRYNRSLSTFHLLGFKDNSTSI